jgi:hypothetical protein
MRSHLHHADTSTRLLARVAAVGALAALAVTGCSTTSVEDAEGRVFVHGYSEGCDLLNETSVPNDNPDIDLLEGVFSCRDEMSDPRVTGTVDWTLDPYYIHYTTTPMTGRMEASPVLTPDQGDGTWSGEGFGVDIWKGDGLSTVYYNEFIGEGEYDGLVYREWGTQRPGSDGYEIVGYIQPAD